MTFSPHGLSKKTIWVIVTASVLNPPRKPTKLLDQFCDSEIFLDNADLFIRTDFQEDCGWRPQCRSLRGSRPDRCQRGCCSQGRTWISIIFIVFLMNNPLIEVSPTNLVFVPLLPPLVPPRLPPLHGLNTWDQKLRTLLTILEDVEDLVGKVYDTSEIILEDVEHLVGKVLSASSKSSSPGCWVDGAVAGEELCVHVLVPSSLRSWTHQNYKTGSGQELKEFHPSMFSPASRAGDWPVERVGGEVIGHPHGSWWAACTEFPNNLSAPYFLEKWETRNHPVKCM